MTDIYREFLRTGEASQLFGKHACIDTILNIFCYPEYIYICMCVYMLLFVCMQIFIYLSIYTYTHIFFICWQLSWRPNCIELRVNYFFSEFPPIFIHILHSFYTHTWFVTNLTF